MQEVEEEAVLEKQIRAKTPEGSAIIFPQEPELGDAALVNRPDTGLSAFSQDIPEQQGGHSVLPQFSPGVPRARGCPGGPYGTAPNRSYHRG